MPNHEFKVEASKICSEFKHESIFTPDDFDKVTIANNEVNRPSLQIAGFFEYFDNTRIQVIGMVETSYLLHLDANSRMSALEALFEKQPPLVIITRGMDALPEMEQVAIKNNVPLMRTSLSTSRFMAALIAYLNIHLAPRITMHGVLVEVYGEGILLLGDSGVGKSETAIELVKRGHRLIADDAVEIKRVSDSTLVGSSPEIIRHFVELRGIGIVDVRRIFGMGAIKDTEKIDLVINLEIWKDKKQYDRLGLSTQYNTILDIEVPSITLPVKPGRNLAVVIEVAAMINRQKRMGYNAAEALNNRLISDMEDKLKQNKGEN